ncbi:MAG: CHAT domain-containing protein [Pseudomonadota bacterium]
MASLWRVDDRSTSDLMTHFYSQSTGAESLALALQAAQLKMIRGESPTPPSVLQRFRRWTGLEDDPAVARHHPYHWAGFALNGRADSKR